MVIYVFTLILIFLIKKDFSAFCGLDTTSTEVQVIENIFGLSDLNVNDKRMGK